MYIYVLYIYICVYIYIYALYIYTYIVIDITKVAPRVNTLTKMIPSSKLHALLDTKRSNHQSLKDGTS